jgi:3-hydroxybutyrate dehydrogenase
MQGRVVIVTGAAMGIGRHIAHSFAKEGANVAIGDIEDQGLNSVSDELRDLGADVLALKTNVRDEAEV